MAQSLGGRGDDVTQRGGPGKAARLTDQSAEGRDALHGEGRALSAGKSAGQIGSFALTTSVFQWVGLNA